MSAARTPSPGGSTTLAAELAAARTELARREGEWRAQMEIAARVHRSMLPRPVRHPGIDVVTSYVPVDGVGGDYCQVLFPAEPCCYVTMCDVTGHGIGAALLATRVSSHVRQLAFDGRRPMQIVEGVNAFIWEHFRDTDLQLSLFAARIDLRRRKVEFSGAGHPGPLLIRHDTGQIEVLKSQNVLIGVAEHCMGREPEGGRDLRPRDRLLFFTDGLTEARDPAGRMLETDGLVRIATVACADNLFGMADCVVERVALFRDGPPQDDMTLIVAEIK
jgi:sigma-B regulation protein RsbU (phosphoserine phosphatase)